MIQADPYDEVRDVDPPEPGAFASRRAYREALIERENRRDYSQFDDLAHRLRDLGLKTTASRASQLIVVEGLPSVLRRALEEKGVTTAGFDEELNLIAPVSKSEDLR